jgi:DNA-binding NtrC family response regulator
MKPEPILILLAEDDPAHVTAILRAFDAGGPEFKLEVVGSLQEFRRFAASRRPAIAVMDLNLPDGRAAEVLTQPPEAGPFPILVMTSYGNEQMAVTAIKAGALDYVVKSAEAFADMPHTITRVLHEWNLRCWRKKNGSGRSLKMRVTGCFFSPRAVKLYRPTSPSRPCTVTPLPKS